MRIFVSDHQDKARALKDAIIQGGHELVNSYRADIMLIDWDGPLPHYLKTIERAYEGGADIYIYSHGGYPLTCWDGVIEPHEYTAGYLAQTPGEAGVLERYEYPRPVHVIGWHYCGQKDFTPTEIKRVLFAPWHPQGNGYLNPECKKANIEVMNTLSKLQNIELTVRYVGTLKDNGLEELPGVTYQRASRTIYEALQAIDATDLVVANPGTVATLAVAHGKPMVMYGQDIRPHDGYSEETLKYVENWEKYKYYMRYPHDISGYGEVATWFVMQHAAAKEARDWRKKFIGEQFDPKAFVKLLEELHDE